jgi:hypothetical protein
MSDVKRFRRACASHNQTARCDLAQHPAWEGRLVIELQAGRAFRISNLALSHRSPMDNMDMVAAVAETTLKNDEFSFAEQKK